MTGRRFSNLQTAPTRLLNSAHLNPAESICMENLLTPLCILSLNITYQEITLTTVVSTQQGHLSSTISTVSRSDRLKASR